MDPMSRVDLVWRQLHEGSGSFTDTPELPAAVSRASLEEIATSLNRLRPVRFVKTTQPREFASSRVGRRVPIFESRS